MEIETKQHNILKEILNCLSNYNDELNIKFSDIGISINCIDRSNIAMVRVKLLKLIFTKFEFKEGDSICIMLPEINSILKTLKLDDTLNIKEVENQLLISINNNKKFTMGILDDTKEEFSMDKKIDYDIEIIINKDKTCEYINDLTVIKDSSLRFSLKNKRLILSKSTNTSRGEIILQDNIDTDKEINAKYTDKYIVNYNPIMKLGNSLKLRFKEDSPISLISELKNSFRCEFILAPLVDNS